MNPKTKVYENGVLSARFHQKRHTTTGKYKSPFFTRAKAVIIFAIRKTLQAAAVVVAGALLFYGGQLYNEYVALNTVSVAFADTKPADTQANIMNRIADCESGNGKPGTRRQFMPNGDVVMHVNANGLWQDVGMYEINQSPEHMQLEAKLGFNVLTLEGNTSMANYIYANEGTGPWSSSQYCWRR